MTKANSSPETLPEPNSGETPVEYADRLGHWYTSQLTRDEQKHWGIYLTPIPVARFMARAIQADSTSLKLLDPDAGAGILACAAAEALTASETGVKRIEIEAHEIDPRMRPILEKVFSYLAKHTEQRNVALKTRVSTGDFILGHSHELAAMGGLFAFDTDEHGVDVVIANPPYFKLAKSDPRAQAASRVVVAVTRGQRGPNRRASGPVSIL